MRSEDNFLVKFLDGQNEIDQENMYGDGKKNGGTFDERPGDKSVAQPAKSCQQNIIINPKESSWYSLWVKLIHLCLFYGMVNDPLYVAFHIAGQSIEDTEPQRSMVREFSVDVIFCMNIGFKFLTASENIFDP